MKKTSLGLIVGVGLGIAVGALLWAGHRGHGEGTPGHARGGKVDQERTKALHDKCPVSGSTPLALMHEIRSRATDATPAQQWILAYHLYRLAHTRAIVNNHKDLCATLESTSGLKETSAVIKRLELLVPDPMVWPHYRCASCSDFADAKLAQIAQLATVSLRISSIQRIRVLGECSRVAALPQIDDRTNDARCGHVCNAYNLARSDDPRDWDLCIDELIDCN